MYRRRILCILYGAVDFLIVPSKGLYGAAGAWRLSSFMHLSSPSRAIKFFYAPAPLPPTVRALKPPSWALHLLGLSLANICVCTRNYAGMHKYYARMHT
jgi:hypothetical protein